jgi:hypothetical protein
MRWTEPMTSTSPAGKGKLLAMTLLAAIARLRQSPPALPDIPRIIGRFNLFVIVIP